MKIDIQKIVRPIHLADYAPEYEGQVIYVWVNPPRQLRLDYWGVSQEFSRADEERTALLAETAKAIEEETLTPDQQAAAAEQLEGFGRSLNDLAMQLFGIMAEMWSQNEDAETHWTAQDINELVEACTNQDARLWSWIQEQHWRLIEDHRTGVKKKSSTQD